MTELIIPTAPRSIDPDAPQYNARLVRREDENESLAYFWVRFDGEPTPFLTGQYMTIGVMVDGKIVQRPYSVASAPAVAGSEGYELYVRLVQGGTFTPLLCRAAGRARDADDRAEGQVHAPARRRPDPHLHLVGNRERAVRGDDAPAPDRRPAASGRLPQRRLATPTSWAIGRRSRSGRTSGSYPVTYIPTVSRPNDPRNRDWTGRTGRVETILGPVLDELGLSPADSVAYICGNPDMILTAEETLLDRGYPEDQVHKELYWPKGKEPRGMAAADIAAAIEAAEANEDQ